MDRVIKFRGKRIDNGEWIYGSMYRLSEELNPFIMLINKCGESHEVNPSTVGQFTGLTDKNCKEIYKGDVLTDEVFNYIVIFYGGAWCLRFGKDSGTWNSLYPVAHLRRKIGNIFDNPELLKETENKDVKD